jgi:anti-sigma factor RsiW
MLIPVPPTDCMRAREAVSVRLDGELCELDEVRLDQHLDDCPACSRFAADAARTTQVLRDTPLVTAPLAPFVARRRYPVRVPFAAAAAVMLIAATSGSLFLAGRFLGGAGASAGRMPPAITAPRQPGGLEIGDIAMLRNAGPLSRNRGLVPV